MKLENSDTSSKTNGWLQPLDAESNVPRRRSLPWSEAAGWAAWGPGPGRRSLAVTARPLTHNRCLPAPAAQCLCEHVASWLCTLRSNAAGGRAWFLPSGGPRSDGIPAPAHFGWSAVERQRTSSRPQRLPSSAVVGDFACKIQESFSKLMLPVPIECNRLAVLLQGGSALLQNFGHLPRLLLSVCNDMAPLSKMRRRLLKLRDGAAIHRHQYGSAHAESCIIREDWLFNEYCYLNQSLLPLPLCLHPWLCFRNSCVSLA